MGPQLRLSTNLSIINASHYIFNHLSMLFNAAGGNKTQLTFGVALPKMRQYYFHLTLLFFLEALLSSINGLLSAETREQCRQGIFLQDTDDSFVANVTKTLGVRSLFECTQQCLREESCVSVKYRPVGAKNQVNCQLIAKNRTQETPSVTENSEEDWTLYTLQEVESPSCTEKKFCQNGGKCIVDMCEPEGYICDCGNRYHGNRCEKQNYNYDAIFQKESVGFLVTDPIKTDFNALTFTCWFKTEVGFSEYPFLSYTTNGTSAIEIYFGAELNTTSNVPIFQFSGNLLNEEVGCGTIPMNDGRWHHLGFTWSSGGTWLLFIDGVLWATRKGILNGKSLPAGGSVIIGARQNSTFVGKMSRVNFWSEALNGNEIETMAKNPGEERGDLLNWFDAQDFMTGDIGKKFPSEASNSGESMNYEITLGVDFVFDGGHLKVLEQMSTCVWFKRNSKNVMFFSYKTADSGVDLLAFGYGDGVLAGFINNVWINSSTLSSVNNYWHFLCLTWDGNSGALSFYFDGIFHSSGALSGNDMLKTVIPAGGNLIIGAKWNNETGMFIADTTLVGTMSQLNIWGFKLHNNNMRAMSAGGANIHGDVLSWGDLANKVVGNNQKHSVIFIPGYRVLTRRTNWCRNYYADNNGVVCTVSSLLARLGGERYKRSMLWRCYCPEALMPARFTYDLYSGSSLYHSKHADIIANIIND